MEASTRPLTLGEILDRTVQLYRRNFLLLVGIATPPSAVLVLLSGAVGIFFASRIFSLAQTGRTGQPPVLNGADALVLTLVSVLFLFIGLPLMLGVFSMAFAALNHAAAQIQRGEPATIRSSYAFAFSRFWRHVGILFLQALFAGIVPYFVFIFLIFIGAILAALMTRSGAGNTLAPLFVVALILLLAALVVICILIWLRFSLAYPVSVAEDQKAWPSLQRSNQLTQGTRGRIFAMFLLVFILTLVVSSVLTLPLDFLIVATRGKAGFGAQAATSIFALMQAVSLGVSFLVRIFVMPIYSVALMLFYIDQRTRQEGYDIEQLMLRAGWPAQATTPPAIPFAGADVSTPFPSMPPGLNPSGGNPSETLPPVSFPPHLERKDA